MSFVYIQFKGIKIIFDTWIGPYQVLPLRARVGLGAIAMKRYSAFPKPTAILELHCYIFRKLVVGVLALYRDAVGEFYCPSQLGQEYHSDLFVAKIAFHNCWVSPTFFPHNELVHLPYIVSKVKLAIIVEGNRKAPFSIATTPRCRGGGYSFPGLLYFTLDTYLIILSVKQGGIKYHFLSLWYDSTWYWTQVSRAIGEHSNR